MRREREEGRRRSKGNQKQPYTSTGGDNHIQPRWSVKSRICERKLAITVKGQHDSLNQGLPEEVDDHPQEGQTGDAVASLGWVSEKGYEPYDQTEKESSRPHNISGPCDFDPVVVEDRISSQDLGEQTVAKIVKELSDDDAERRAEGSGDHKC